MRCRLLLLAVFLLLGGGTAQAYNVGYYTHSSSDTACGTGSRIDPVNFFFYSYGTTGRVRNQLYWHAASIFTYWNHHDGSAQRFYVSGQCLAQDNQFATDSALNLTARFHFREEPVYYESGTIGWSDIADAHKDELVWCGSTPNHAVAANGTYSGYGNGSGFDYGQYVLNWQFHGGSQHTTFQSQIFNTQVFRQCNGWLASDNGYSQWLQIHQTNHPEIING
jgi:hypothetical protein